MQATPATWRMLIESGWKGSPRLVALAGGESVDRHLVLLARAAAYLLIQRFEMSWIGIGFR